MKEREPYDEPTTGSGDPGHGVKPSPDEPVTTGSGDPAHEDQPSDEAASVSRTKSR